MESNATLHVLIKANDQASDALKRLDDTFGTLFKASKTVGTAFVGVGAAIEGALGLAVKNFTSTGDELKNMSDRTGISVKALSELSYAAKASGTSIQTFEGAITKMQTSIVDAFDASKKSAETSEKAQAKYIEETTKVTKEKTDAMAELSKQVARTMEDQAIALEREVADEKANADQRFADLKTDLDRRLAEIKLAGERERQELIDQYDQKGDFSEDAQAELNDRLDELNRQQAQDKEDLLREFGQREADLTQENQDRLAEIYQGNNRKIEDIEREKQRTISDIESDFAAKLADIKVELDTTSEAATASFVKLGVSVDELKAKSPEEQFMTLAEAIAKIENPADRAKIAVDLFGKSGTDLLPMFANGVEGIESLRTKANELGVTFDDISVQKAADLDDAITDVTASFQGVQQTIGEVLTPVLVPLIEKITTIISGVRAWASAHPELTQTITIVAAVIGALLVPIGSLLLILPTLVTSITLVSSAMGALTAVCSPWLIVAAAIVAAGVLIWQNWDTICQWASKLKDWFIDVYNQVKDKVLMAFDWLKSKLEIVLIPFAPLIAAGIAIYKNWDTIVATAKSLWQTLGDLKDKIVDFVANGINWLKDHIEKLLEPLMGFWNTLCDIGDKIASIFSRDYETNVTVNGESDTETDSYAVGGTVRRTGMALVHQGEYVLRQGEMSRGGGIGSGKAEIHVHVDLDGEQVAKTVIVDAGELLYQLGY